MTKTLKIALLSYPFRIFFLLAALWAVVSMLVWLAGWLWGTPLWPGLQLVPHWHAHELLFGLAGAAIAGFLLTAMCNWTGAAPLTGYRLAALAGLWLAGRLAMGAPSWLPPTAAAVIDPAFMSAVALYAGAVLARHGQRRNLLLVFILFAYIAADVSFHAGVIRADFILVRQAETLGLGVLLLLLAIIGGRLIPAFSGNWLERQGRDRRPVTTSPAIERASLALLAVLAFGHLIWPPVVVAWLAGASAALHVVRFVLWRPWLVWREPLLWILHLGYAWLIVALMLRALGAATPLVPELAWQHAAGAGAMATMVVAVMSRVALGHTGRPLTLPGIMVAAYWLLLIAAVTRLMTVFGLLAYRSGLLLSGGAWLLAFAIFLAVYTPILVAPRVDGRPG